MTTPHPALIKIEEVRNSLIWAADRLADLRRADPDFVGEYVGDAEGALRCALGSLYRGAKKIGKWDKPRRKKELAALRLSEEIGEVLKMKLPSKVRAKLTARMDEFDKL